MTSLISGGSCWVHRRRFLRPSRIQLDHDQKRHRSHQTANTRQLQWYVTNVTGTDWGSWSWCYWCYRAHNRCNCCLFFMLKYYLYFDSLKKIYGWYLLANSSLYFYSLKSNINKRNISVRFQNVNGIKWKTPKTSFNFQVTSICSVDPIF